MTERWLRVGRIVTFAAAVSTLGLLLADCNRKLTYENSTSSKLSGFGYFIIPHSFHSNSLIIIADSTTYPFQTVDMSLSRAKRRAVRDCGGELIELPEPVKGRDRVLLEVSVKDRLASSCFPNYP